MRNKTFWMIDPCHRMNVGWVQVDIFPNLLAIFILTLSGLIGFAQTPISISNQRQLFVDHYLIAEITNLRLILHRPMDQGPVLFFDQPWEGPFSAYCTVIHHDSVYQLYYRGLPDAGRDGSDREVTCYAFSTDGVHWQKPKLEQFSWNGVNETNIILASAAPVTHNFSPFLDTNPSAHPTEKYKAIGGTKKSGLMGYLSADGVHWRAMSDQPIYTDGIFDSQNVAFWSATEQRYVCYFRTWTGEGYSGFRSVGRTTSPDFRKWTEGVQMEFGAAPLEHLYTQQTHPYFRAPQIYVAIGARFMPDRQVLTDKQAESLGVDVRYYQDCSDAYLMTSRGGPSYDRTFLESYIRPGIGANNWVSRSNYPALNVVQTGPHEMSIYVNENYAQQSAHLRRYTARLDGFSSLSAGYKIGEMLSKPIQFDGRRLEINFATSAAGMIRVELRGADGLPIPGFGFEDCQEIIGNEIMRQVQWKTNPDLSQLAGKTIKICFQLKDADLFSFRFY